MTAEEGSFERGMELLRASAKQIELAGQWFAEAREAGDMTPQEERLVWDLLRDHREAFDELKAMLDRQRGGDD
jgi:hypothetical protein